MVICSFCAFYHQTERIEISTRSLSVLGGPNILSGCNRHFLCMAWTESHECVTWLADARISRDLGAMTTMWARYEWPVRLLLHGQPIANQMDQYTLCVEYKSRMMMWFAEVVRKLLRRIIQHEATYTYQLIHS